jgi:dipeptidyl aminopeptidase/acylaminoacyl peptidase
MRAKNSQRPTGFLKVLQLAGLCAGLTLGMAQTIAAQDLKRPPALEIFARPEAILSPVLSASGETAYYISHKSNATSLTIHNLIAKTRTDVALTGPEREAVGLSLIDEGHIVIRYRLKTGAAGGASTVDLTARQIAPGGPAQGAAEAPAGQTSPLYGKDGRVLGQVTNADWSTYQFDSPELANLPVLAARAFEDYRVRFVDFAADARKVVLKTEGDDDAGTYYFVDFAQDGFVELGKARPALREEWITDKEAFAYRSRDGLALKGFLSLPAGREPRGLPLIVIATDPDVHTDLGFDPFIAALTTRGYAVLQPVVRQTAGEWGAKALTDMSDAVAFLKARDIVDDKRVCIMGTGAMAGYQALAGAAFLPQQYRCAIDVAGISDFKAYFASPDTQTTAIEKTLMGNESQWADLSPLTKAGNITASVLIIHPKDSVVSSAQSRLMASALRTGGRDVTLSEPALSPEASYEASLKTLKLIVDFLLKADAPY